MKKNFLSLLVGVLSTQFLFVSANSIVSHDFTECGTENHLHVSSIQFSKDVVEPGSDLKVTIQGIPDISISSGAEALVEFRMMGIKMFSETVKLCKEFDIICPLESGKQFTATMTQQIPVETPSVEVQMSVKVSDGDKTMGCFQTSINVKRTKRFVGNYFRHFFKLWIKEHKIEPDNFEKRLEIFTDNLISIIHHNKNPHKTYVKAMNHFGHLTREEFSEYLGYRAHLKSKNNFQDFTKNIFPITFLDFVKSESKFNVPKRKSEPFHELPDSVDWVSKGAVTPVKNQGRCGSCWSFSTTGAIEGAYFLKTGKLISFSEQQLVSCDKGSMGCQGGIMDQAFQWIEDHKGMCSEEDYPYVSDGGMQPDMCRECNTIPGSVVKDFVDVTPNSEQDLMAAVARQTISVAIEADQTSFQFYKSGVLTGKCGANLDHGVLAVGYGTSEDGIDYWKIKNSWGPGWGEDGYIRIERGKKTVWNKSGECGILKQASYPILA